MSSIWKKNVTNIRVRKHRLLVKFPNIFSSRYKQRNSGPSLTLSVETLLKAARSIIDLSQPIYRMPQTIRWFTYSYPFKHATSLVLYSVLQNKWTELIFQDCISFFDFRLRKVVPGSTRVRVIGLYSFRHQPFLFILLCVSEWWQAKLN